MKKLFYYFVSLCSLALITNACTNDENLVDQSSDQQATATTRAATSIQNIVYIEANDVNPLNAGSYVMDGKYYSQPIFVAMVTMLFFITILIYNTFLTTRIRL